jgi:lantibiotic modifying enzyme
MLLADADCLDQLDRAAVDDAVAALAQRRPLRDASLCHGELGIVEALSVLERHGHAGAAEARVHYAARAVGALDRYGPRCGTPNGVPSPGLLTGLAGIGYGLLRLGFADRVPSVLLLEPAFPDR